MKAIDVLRLVGGLSVGFGIQLLWIAITGLRNAGRVIDQAIAEEHKPVRRYAVGVAQVPQRHDGGGEQW